MNDNDNLVMGSGDYEPTFTAEPDPDVEIRDFHDRYPPEGYMLCLACAGPAQTELEPARANKTAAVWIDRTMVGTESHSLAMLAVKAVDCMESRRRGHFHACKNIGDDADRIEKETERVAIMGFESQFADNTEARTEK